MRRDVPNWINSKKESSEIVMGRKFPERDEMPAFFMFLLFQNIISIFLVLTVLINFFHRDSWVASFSFSFSFSRSEVS